jgi:hypothetical protein
MLDLHMCIQRERANWDVLFFQMKREFASTHNPSLPAFANLVLTPEHPTNRWPPPRAAHASKRYVT